MSTNATNSYEVFTLMDDKNAPLYPEGLDIGCQKIALDNWEGFWGSLVVIELEGAVFVAGLLQNVSVDWIALTFANTVRAPHVQTFKLAQVKSVFLAVRFPEGFSLPANPDTNVESADFSVDNDDMGPLHLRGTALAGIRFGPDRWYGLPGKLTVVRVAGRFVFGRCHQASPEQLILCFENEQRHPVTYLANQLQEVWFVVPVRSIRKQDGRPIYRVGSAQVN